MIRAHELIVPALPLPTRAPVRSPRSPGEQDRAERTALLAFDLARGLSITSHYVERRFNVSRATAKRDVALLRRLFTSETLPPGGGPTKRVLSVRGSP